MVWSKTFIKRLQVTMHVVVSLEWSQNYSLFCFANLSGSHTHMGKFGDQKIRLDLPHGRMKCFTCGGCPLSIITFLILLSWDGLIGFYFEEMVEGEKGRMRWEIWVNGKKESFWFPAWEFWSQKDLSSHPPSSSFAYHISLPQFSLL